MLRNIAIFLLIFLFLSSCATTKSEEGADATATGDDARQKELDEIEALLGVQRPPSDKDKKKKTAKEEDTLGLLSSEDVPVKGQGQKQTKTQKPAQDPQREVNQLKSQLSQKDAQITDLKQQVRNQNIQISQLEAQKSTPIPVYTGTVGDVPPGEYQQRYQEGYDQFHARNYKGAIELFESLIASDANNSLSDNAQYWIGESHYALGQYRKAVIDFEKVFTFPKSNKNPDAQFKLGLCYVRLGESNKAREEFQRLLDVYPDSDYVSRVKEHLQNL